MADSRNSPAQTSFPPVLILPPASNPKTSSSHLKPISPLGFTFPKPPPKKPPLLIYIHGGGFIIETAASPHYHDFLNLIAAESNVVIVSFDYRTAPEYPVPTCFNDSWETIKWVAGNCREPWLNDYADHEKVFFAGDSAGANIAHHMAIRVGLENPSLSINLRGIILLHPYFWGKDRICSEGEDPRKTLLDDMWFFAHPGTSGLDDPLINPAMDPKLSDLGCSRVLVCVAEKDIGKNRGWYYKHSLGKNGWNGDIEVIEDEGEDHVFFLFNPSSENASTLGKRIYSFINHMDN